MSYIVPFGNKNRVDLIENFMYYRTRILYENFPIQFLIRRRAQCQVIQIAN